MPIHRLGERPTRTAVLADITCDSDGKIDHFVSLRDVKRTLELHELKPDERYYLAAFLVGGAAGWTAHDVTTPRSSAAATSTAEAVDAYKLYVVEVRHDSQ